MSSIRAKQKIRFIKVYWYDYVFKSIKTDKQEGNAIPQVEQH